MTRWHRNAAKSTRLCHTPEDAKSDGNGKDGVGEGGAAVLIILLSTNAEMK